VLDEENLVQITSVAEGHMPPQSAQALSLALHIGYVPAGCQPPRGGKGGTETKPQADLQIAKGLRTLNFE
jgi:hypothetical protein